jgi:hypothetical protein
VVISADSGTKDLRCGDVCVAKQVSGVKSASARDPPVQAETTHTREASVLDIALVLGHTGTINRNAVCCLLTECLQDVCCAIFASCPLVAYCLASNVPLFLQQAVSLTKAVETIIAEDSAASLRKRVAELEAVNS